MQGNSAFRILYPPTVRLHPESADDAIHQIEMVNSIDPSIPFFVYLSPGVTHAPHHPTKEWVDKISAMTSYGSGWGKPGTIRTRDRGAPESQVLCAAALQAPSCAMALARE